LYRTGATAHATPIASSIADAHGDQAADDEEEVEGLGGLHGGLAFVG